MTLRSTLNYSNFFFSLFGRKFGAPSSSSSGPSKAPAATTNAFASTKLVANNNAPPPPSNPFAAVQLNSGTTAPPSFSFGAAPKTEPKPFSFGQSSSQQQSSLKSTSSSSPKPTATANNKAAQIKEINENFFKMIQDHVKKGYIASDLSSLMEQYIHVAENVELDEEEEDDGGDGDNKDENGNNNNSGGSSKSEENKSQPSSTPFSGFSFASSSAPPPSSGGTTFSFTGGSTAPAPTAATVSKPTFSFGTQPAASGGSSSINNTTNEDDPTSNPDDGKLEVGQEENEDEEKLYEVLARLNKLEDKAWKKECKGPLRLYRNKTTDKKRMVLRNDAGRVMFNVAISNGMTFQKVSEKTQKGKDIWYVQFFAVVNAGEGAKPIRLNVVKDEVDRFHEELEKLAA